MFASVPIRRAEIIRERVTVGEFLDGSAVQIPVVTVGGMEEGPTLYIQAGLHGDEQTGIEICRRFLSGIDPHRLHGNIVAVPLANVPAHLSRTRGFLHEERWMVDMNRVFPGNPNGLLSERIAYLLFNEFVQMADFTIDLHSALDGCTIVPFVYVTPFDDDAGTLDVRMRAGHAFGTPYVFHKERNTPLGTSDMTRSLSSQADLAKAPMISAEMGESRRVSVEYVQLGERGIHNVMQVLGMEDAPPDPLVPAAQVFTRLTVVHSQRGGGLRTFVRPGAEVSSGEPIAEIVDVFGTRVEQIDSPSDGFVLRLMLLGVAASGAEIAWIAQ